MHVKSVLWVQDQNEVRDKPRKACRDERWGKAGGVRGVQETAQKTNNEICCEDITDVSGVNEVVSGLEDAS